MVVSDQLKRWRGTAIIVVTILSGLTNASQFRAQSPLTPDAPLPSFEVVSIKPDRSGVISTKYSPNRYTVTYKNAKFFIKLAYGSSVSRYTYPLRDDQVEGGPGWINNKYYDVDAKIEDTQAEQFRQHPEQLWGPLRLMLRSMLADRFKLQVSHTTKVVPAYALVAAKDGAKFLDQKMMPGDSYASFSTPNQPARGKPCVPKMGWACMANYLSMGDLAVLLSGLPEMTRPVIDQTGLKDTYFLRLEYEHTHRPASMFSAQAGGGADITNLPPPAEPSGPSLTQALEKQLGLKLQPTRGPVDVIVIEHIEMPSEN